MYNRTKERGITFLGLMMLLILLSFVGLIGLKLIPVYLQSFKLNKALSSVVAQDLTAKTQKEIEFMMLKRLDIDSFTWFRQRDYKKYMTVKKTKSGVTIDVIYRAETPMFANIGVVVDFDKHAQTN